MRVPVLEEMISWIMSRASGAIFGWGVAVCTHGNGWLGAITGVMFATTLDFTLRHVRKFY